MQELHKLIMAIINGEMKQAVNSFDISEMDLHELEVQEKISFASIMKTWGVVINSPAPNINAIRKFMRDRYKVFEVDVPHDQLF